MGYGVGDGPRPKPLVPKGLQQRKLMLDLFGAAAILVSVMSEQSYLQIPSSANARVDIAGVEGSLEYIAENIGTEWCSLDDIKGIIDEARKTLDGARHELRDAETSHRTRVIERLI